MTINTKYNIGQEVWFMNENKACSDIITAVHTYITETFSNVTYGFGNTIQTQIITTIKESDLFPTKEELLRSL